jgi:N-ethylmaleimide reductase
MSAEDLRRSPAQRLWISCAQIPRRLARGGPYKTPHRDSFYGGAEGGHTDYPFLAGTDIA